MAPKAQTLYLIDGHAQLYRAYHAIRPGDMFAADRKTPTNAVFGFGNMLRSLRSRFKPDLLAAVFDPHGAVKRETQYNQYAEKLGKAFSGYKTQRDAMPNDLRPQIDLALELCVAYGIPAIQIEGYEADDVLGTLALLASRQGLKAVIVSGDKDLLQMVCDDISVYDPMKDITYDADTVYSLKGVKPCQIIDWLGFRGDSSDNIPGVTGVGDQTAIKLLQTHGSMEIALEHYIQKFEPQRKEILEFVSAHELESEKDKEQRQGLKPPKGVKVVEAYLFAQGERARACRELARLTTDLPLTLDLDQLRCRPPEVIKLAPLLKRLDFKKFLQDLDKEGLALFESQAAIAEETARKEAGETQIDTIYTIVDSSEKLHRLMAELKNQTHVAIAAHSVKDKGAGSVNFAGSDNAGTARGAELIGIALSWSAHHAWYVPLIKDGNSKLPAPVVAVLEDAGVHKSGHQIEHLIKILRDCGISLRGVNFDTMVGGWLLDPGATRLDLDEMAYHHLGIRKAEEKPAAQPRPALGLFSDDDLGLPACKDADHIWQLGGKLEPMLKDAGLEPLMQQIEVPLIDVLADMEYIGIKVDVNLLGKMSKSLEQQLAALEEDIFALAGERFNISSTSQLRTILFEKLGLESKTKTATGQDSTSEEVLSQLAKSHDLPRVVLEYRGMLKLKNTYVDVLPGMVSAKTGRIHARFHQTGAETGRISSSDPNLQNIPIRSELGRSIRAAFKPGFENWKIVCVDYSQIELRILAHYSQDPALLEAFSKGVDIHTAVAAKLNNVSETEVTREQRSQAKAVNFGIIYGQSPFGLSKVLAISSREAQNIIDTYYSNHAAVRGCIKEIIATAAQKGYVTTVLGRRRFIPQLNGSDRGTRALGERLAVNTVFQGSAADLIKKAMVDIHRILKSGGWQANMLLQIHDELLFECPPDEVDRLLALVKDKMEHALKLNTPLVVDTGVGVDWLSAKD